MNSIVEPVFGEVQTGKQKKSCRLEPTDGSFRELSVGEEADKQVHTVHFFLEAAKYTSSTKDYQTFCS